MMCKVSNWVYVLVELAVTHSTLQFAKIHQLRKKSKIAKQAWLKSWGCQSMERSFLVYYQIRTYLNSAMWEIPKHKACQKCRWKDIFGRIEWCHHTYNCKIDWYQRNEAALSVLHTTFMDRNLKEGTYIFLTWVEPSKLLVCENPFWFTSLVPYQLRLVLAGTS